MTKFYATTDNEGSYINEDAEIVAFDTREECVAYLNAAYVDGLNDGERITVCEGDFGDCWIKSLDRPSVGDAVLSPFTYNQIMVRDPGAHPGGKVWWLTPQPPVMVAVIGAA